MAFRVTAPKSQHKHIDLRAGALERARRRVRVRRAHAVKRGLLALPSRVA
jgi:hypothetical protein